MEKQDFKKLMNDKGNLMPITEEWRGQGKIPKGALIGFMAFGKERGITAAYPFWREVGNQIQFVLIMPGEATWTDKAIMDNSYFTSEVFINEEPIIVEVNDKQFLTFGGALGQMFGKPAQVHTSE